ncbi:beta-ketoadipate pathway transcriptional regulator, PcaR/PcaU/PobR family [compost metagenome]
MLQNQRGIQSVEVACQILHVICSSYKPLSLSEIAERVDMAPGSVHIYLVSLIRTGLLKRNEITLEYGPGALGLRLGISHFDNNPTLTKAKEKLSELAQKYNLNVFLSLWSNEGPTVIFYREFAGFLNISFKLGITLSLLETTTGHLFCAYKDKSEIINILDRKDPSKKLSTSFSSGKFQEKIKNIRHDAIVISENLPTYGITAIAVPVIDQVNQMNLALTVFTETEKIEAMSNTKDILIEDLKQIALSL